MPHGSTRLHCFLHRPETQTYIQKMEQDKADKAKGQQADNKSFLGLCEYLTSQRSHKHVVGSCKIWLHNPRLISGNLLSTTKHNKISTHKLCLTATSICLTKSCVTFQWMYHVPFVLIMMFANSMDPNQDREGVTVGDMSASTSVEVQEEKPF